MVLLTQRAAEAERLVLARFVGRWLHVPVTRLGRSFAPAAATDGPCVVDRRDPFNYWWQAHLLDAIVDGGGRRLSHGDTHGARRSALLGHRLLVTLWLRNGARLRNHFYDDMAWLALAVGRLAALDEALRLPVFRLSLAPARRSLTRQLLQGRDSTGGVVWNKDRDFLNVPAAGPVALHLARSGRTREARTILEWISSELTRGPRGLVLDGLRRDGSLVEDVYTYNQGTTLAVLLELGEPQDLERAAALVDAIGDHLSRRRGRRRVLVTHGGGDGGLFTGILVRYLALAATHPGLEGGVQERAAALVLDMADVLWEGRDPATGVFPSSTTIALADGEGGARVELSTQLQAWTVMEAAAHLSAPRQHP